MTFTSRTAFLTFLASIGKINPAIYDVIFPHGPVFSVGARDVMAAMLIKSIAREVKDVRVAQELDGLGKKLFATGTKTMSYTDDDWCGTPWPHPVGPQQAPWSIDPGSLVGFNPQPDPPGVNYYGALLVLLADVISVKEIGTALKKTGTALMEKTIKQMPKAALHQ